MKLRILNDSIRLRLSRGEVDRLLTERLVRASLTFPEGRTLDYVCRSVTDLTSPAATFDGSVVDVRLPEAEVEGWATSDQVSVSAETVFAGGRLTLLVEKDFACLSPREGEDETDLFVHPQAGKERC